MQIAKQVATYSKCLKKQVGCAIYSAEGFLLSIGYNKGQCNLQEICYERKLNASCKAVHAEIDAFDNLVNHKAIRELTEGGYIECTLSPCARCLHRAYNNGIKKIIYLEKHKEHEETILLYQRYGIE